MPPGSPPHSRGTRRKDNGVALRDGITPAFTGNTIPQRSIMPPPGITPAFEGNTRAPASRCAPNRDHPRIRGEHGEVYEIDLAPGGSPPHSRGTRSGPRIMTVSKGITPAFAGNTTGLTGAGGDHGDHPRIRGEHEIHGLPPHHCEGSPPHSRGTHEIPVQTRRERGITPAFAGNTNPCNLHLSCDRDHPRIRGEHLYGTRPFGIHMGSPPHSRGTPTTMMLTDIGRRITPAFAGNTPPCPG